MHKKLALDNPENASIICDYIKAEQNQYQYQRIKQRRKKCRHGYRIIFEKSHLEN